MQLFLEMVILILAIAILCCIVSMWVKPKYKNPESFSKMTKTCYIMEGIELVLALIWSYFYGG